MNLKAYLETTTQTALAGDLGVSQGLVHQWVHGITRITAERCKQIERVTAGRVTRYELRPDLFDKPSDAQEAAA